MKIKVNKKHVVNDSQLVNSGEFHVNPLFFEFSEEYENLHKVAVFTRDSISYYRVIENNSCFIPYDVINEKGEFTLGVYAYIEEDGNLILRYSPTPINIIVNEGSYKSEAIPPVDEPEEQYVRKVYLLDNYYNKEYINELILKYYDKEDIDDLLTNYYSKKS